VIDDDANVREVLVDFLDVQPGYSDG